MISGGDGNRFSLRDPVRPPKGPAAPKPAPTGPAPIAVPTRDTARRPHDESRTRVEARVAFPSVEEEDEIPTPTRRFTIRETTSGLPDDSREEDERQAERRVRILRGRVKAARAVVSGTPGLAETLAGDWKRAAGFYVRFGITRSQFCYGVRAEDRSTDPSTIPSDQLVALDIRSQAGRPSVDPPGIGGVGSLGLGGARRAFDHPE